MKKKMIFLGGCGRSGTSALVRTLNAHRKVVIGQERYWNRWNSGTITTDLFTPERFMTPVEGDSHNNFLEQSAREKFSEKIGDCIYLGDKFPRIFEHYDSIDALFPDAKIVYIVRNPFSVAESYQARFDDPNDSWKLTYKEGVEAWNRSLEATAARLSLGKPVIVVSYECLYGSKDIVRKLFEVLDLDFADVNETRIDEQLANYRALSEKSVRRREEVRRWVALNASFDLYRKIVAHPGAIRRDLPVK